MRKSVVFLLIGLAFMAALSTYVYRKYKNSDMSQAQGQMKIEAVAVEGQPVIVRSYIQELKAVGTLVANESVIIRPETDGMIAQILFESGTEVSKKKLLFKLDDGLVSAQLSEAQAQLNQATQEYNRAKALAEKKYVSNRELDKMSAQLNVAKAQSSFAKVRASKTSIHAPFDGMIGLSQHSVGAYVRAGEDLVSLVDIDPLKVDFRLGEENLKAVKVGQKVSVKVDGFKEMFKGQIEAIEPKIDLNGHSILVRAKIQNEGKRLRPGLFATIFLVVKVEKEAIFVPESALEAIAGQQFVYRVMEGRAVQTPVTVGAYDEGLAYIEDGLWSMDTVVTAGGMKIADGTPIRVIDPKAKQKLAEEAKAKGKVEDPSLTPDASDRAAPEPAQEEKVEEKSETSGEASVASPDAVPADGVEKSKE